MNKIECDGCEHTDGKGEHCHGVGLDVKSVTERECRLAQIHGRAFMDRLNHLPTEGVTK